MANGDDVGPEDLVPVPHADAEALLSRATTMIEQLDTLIVRRNGRRWSDLGSWEAPNRVVWDEDFTYAQLDLQAVIDNLQAFKGEIDEVMTAIEEHNDTVRARLGPFWVR